MHTDQIKKISVDAACTLLATASFDKTVRLWRLPQGKLLNTVRPPIGPGDEGKIYAVALAPDGNWLAAGGWTANGERAGDWAIYIIDAASGSVRRRLLGISHRVNHLAVSPDGRYLAAVLKSGHGLRVWETKTWRRIAEDENYGDDAYGAAFDQAGTLYTTAWDGKLRRYAPGYKGDPVSIVTRGASTPTLSPYIRNWIALQSDLRIAPLSRSMML
jgi:hypothetical protein